MEAADLQIDSCVNRLASGNANGSQLCPEEKKVLKLIENFFKSKHLQDMRIPPDVMERKEW